MSGVAGPNLDGFDVFEVCDPAEMDERSRISQRLPGPNRVHTYTLRDAALRRSGSRQPLSRLATRVIGDVRLSHVADRFGTEIGIRDPGMNAYCFSMLRAGRVAVLSAEGAHAIVAGEGGGWVHSGKGGTRVLTADGTARSNLWIPAHRLQSALHGCLGEDPRRPLVFEPRLDWRVGAGAGLHRLLLHLIEELQRPDGLAADPTALAAFTDLFVHTALRGLPHTYSERLALQRNGAAPKYVRRAETYMREHAERPILMQDVAAAAGCSVRALQLAFRRFRDTTPHAALHRIRLELARETLVRGEALATSVAKRYGFTNAGRFAAAYARRFGERPSETRQKLGS